MRYAQFGRTGTQVSELCLGTMTFGNESDEGTSFEIMDRCYDAGVNFFDTADVYNGGVTEEITGRWLQGKRDRIVLASKVYYPTGEGVNDKGSSRLHIVRGVEASLQRLQTDWLDVLYLHHWDDTVPIEESLAAIDTLVQQGKVCYGGVSNFSAWQTMKAIDAAQSRNLASVHAIQPMYSLVKRQVEAEILPLAKSEGIAVCPYSPMGAGLLTGKYQRKEKGRIDVHPAYIARYKNPEYMETSNRFVAYADEKGLSPAALSVAWVLKHPEVTSAIVGARNVEQINVALSSQDIELDAEQREEITALSPEMPNATDREQGPFQALPAKK